MLGVLAALSVGIVVEYWLLFSAPSEVRTASRERAPEGSLESDEPEQGALPPVPRARILEALAALGGEPRSPFSALTEAREQVRIRHRLTGTLVSRGHRVAWIDGRPRVVGDWLGSSRVFVSRIDDGRAVLSGGGGPIELRVEPEAPPAAGTPSKGLGSIPAAREGDAR